VYVFYKQWKKTLLLSSSSPVGTRNNSSSSGTDNQQQQMMDDNDTIVPQHSFLKSKINSNNNPIEPFEPSSSLYDNENNILLKSNNDISPISPTITTATDLFNNNEQYVDSTNVYVEVQEGDLPVRKAFRYFPFLSQWKMRKLMIFPRLRYISYYSVKIFFF
jgi:hypothetical protein